MIFPEKRKLFTISEVAKACGVSRTSLIRMEEDGFLKPYRIDPDTGYRYYDMQNVASVGQYQRLQELGISRKEIADLYYERVDTEKFIEKQRARLSKMQSLLEEYEFRHDHSKNHLFSYLTLPEVVCFCADIVSNSIGESATLSYLAHQKCMEAGYRLLGSETMFAIASGDSNDISIPVDTRFTACIPVLADPGKDPRIRRFPATEAFSVLGFGNYDTQPALWDLLREESARRGLEPSGPPRLIALVAPYTGAHYKTDDFCSQCVIPIKERKG